MTSGFITTVIYIKSVSDLIRVAMYTMSYFICNAIKDKYCMFLLHYQVNRSD